MADILQYEPDGRAYTIVNGAKNYIPAWMLRAADGDKTAYPPSDPRSSEYQPGGFIRGRGQWDSAKGEYKRPINWGNILAAGTAAAITGGAASAAMGASAPAAAAPAGVGIGETGAVTGLAGSGFGGSTAAAGGTAGLLSRAQPFMQAAGRGINAATQAAASNRGAADDFTLQADRDYESSYANRADLDEQQRRRALADISVNNYYTNRTPSRNNVKGFDPVSQEFLQNLSAAEQAAVERLKQPQVYQVPGMAPLTRRTPTKPGKGEKIGNWVGPALSLWSGK